MYLYLGQNRVVSKADVIGVFDLDNCTGTRITRDYLSRAEKRGRVEDVSAGALPKMPRRIIYIGRLWIMTQGLHFLLFRKTC